MTSKENCFTFVWKLENIIYCIQKQGEYIESPAFVVHAIESTKWRLRYYPTVNEYDAKIGYYLHREEDSSGGDTVEIKYELNIIEKDGGAMEKSSARKGIFSKGALFGNESILYQTTCSLDIRKPLISINDTLVLRCRIWKCKGEMIEDVKCKHVTRIEVEKRAYQWDVKNFSTLELGKKTNHQIKYLQNDSSQMSVDLYLSEELNTEGKLLLDLSPGDKTIKKASLLMYLINSSGTREFSSYSIKRFDPANARKHFDLALTKKELLDKRSSYLPNDTLSLILSWRLSRGVVSEEVERDNHESICFEVNSSDAQNSSGDQNTLFNVFENTINCSYELSDGQKFLLSAFVDDLKCLYDERFLSDVKLQTETSEFPAHKLILSSSSSVFKAMFSRDMKENINDCVHIEDLNDDTVSRMLHFIYSTRVEDLTWESARKLYVAADKYDISSLKNLCSSFLKEHLSSSNACDALLLADLHADDDLKSVVQDYIIKNMKQISKSEEWKALMKANGTLAAETMCKLFG